MLVPRSRANQKLKRTRLDLEMGNYVAGTPLASRITGVHPTKYTTLHLGLSCFVYQLEGLSWSGLGRSVRPLHWNPYFLPTPLVTVELNLTDRQDWKLVIRAGFQALLYATNVFRVVWCQFPCPDFGSFVAKPVCLVIVMLQGLPVAECIFLFKGVAMTVTVTGDGDAECDLSKIVAMLQVEAAKVRNRWFAAVAVEFKVVKISRDDEWTRAKRLVGRYIMRIEIIISYMVRRKREKKYGMGRK